MEVLRTETTIAMARYVRDFRDAERVWSYCAQCPRYGRVWACPPLDFDADAYLAPYTTMRIFATQIFFSSAQAAEAPTETAAVMERALEAAWDIELPRLMALEAATPGSRVFTGRCRLCRPAQCTRTEGKPCRHPDQMRHSLEALGFDLEKTSRELLGITLQWAAQGQLPPYLTLLTAIAT